MEEVSWLSRGRGSASHRRMARGGVSRRDRASCAGVWGGVALTLGTTPARQASARAARSACRLRAACMRISCRLMHCKYFPSTLLVAAIGSSRCRAGPVSLVCMTAQATSSKGMWGFCQGDICSMDNHAQDRKQLCKGSMLQRSDCQEPALHLYSAAILKSRADCADNVHTAASHLHV